jgi:hypothetical protein
MLLPEGLLLALVLEAAVASTVGEPVKLGLGLALLVTVPSWDDVGVGKGVVVALAAGVDTGSGALTDSISKAPKPEEDELPAVSQTVWPLSVTVDPTTSSLVLRSRNLQTMLSLAGGNPGPPLAAT